MASGLAKLELVLEAIDRASGPLRNVDRAIEQVERTAKRSSGIMDRLGERGSRALNALGTAAKIGAVAGIVAVTAAMGAGVKEAREFETALSSIQKKASTSDAQTAAIGDKIKKLATMGDLAAPLSEVWSAYERGAAANLKGAELDRFAALSTKAADAFEMSAEDVGNAAAGFNTALEIPMNKMEGYFDLINSLADSGIAAERDIVNFLDRAGPSLKVFGQTNEQAAALGSTLLNLKMPADVGARAMSTLSTKLLAPGSKSAAAALKKIVGDQVKFNKLLKQSPNDALLLYLDKIRAMDKFDAAELLTSHLGAGFSDEVIRLATGVDELRRNLKLAEDQSKWLGSLGKSYATKVDTVDAQWQIFKNNLWVGRIETMSRLLPAINAGLRHMSGIMSTLDQRATVFQRIGAGLDGFGSGIGIDNLDGLGATLLDIAASAEEFVFGVADAEQSADQLGRAFEAARRAGAALRPVFDGLKLAVTTSWAAIEAAWGKLETLFPNLGAGLKDFGVGALVALVAIAAVSIALGAIASVGATVLGVVVALAGMFGWVGLAAAAAAGLLYANWDTVGPYFEQLGATIATAWTVVQDAWGQASAFFSGLDWASLIPQDVPGVSALEGLGRAIGGIVDSIRGLASFTGNTLVSYFSGFFEGFSGYVEPLIKNLVDIWNRVGPILDNFGQIGSAIGGMFSAIGANAGAMGAVQQFGVVMGNLAGIVANVTLTGIEGLLRFIEMVSGVTAALAQGDWSAARAAIQRFVDWLGSLSFADIGLDFTLEELLPDISAADMIAKVKGWFPASWADVLPKWDDVFQLPQVTFDPANLVKAIDAAKATAKAAWDGIVALFDLSGITIDTAALKAGMNAVVNTVMAGWERLKAVFELIRNAAAGVAQAVASALSADDLAPADQLAAMASVGVGQWDAGLAAIDRFRAGLVDIQGLAAELKPFAPDGGYLTPYQNQVRRTLELVEQLANASIAPSSVPSVPQVPVQVPDVPTAPALPNVDAVAATQAQVDGINQAIEAATTAANALPAGVTAALDATRAAVAGFDLAADGQRVMASFNAGLTAGGAASAGIMRGTMASISAAASLDLTAKGANIMNTLAAGMRARAGAVIEEIRRVTQMIRDHLPSSPAKIGPLSDLHRLKFGETIASSIRHEPVERAMRALSAAAMSAGRLPETRSPAGLGALMPDKPRALGAIQATARNNAQANDNRSGGGGQTIDASMHIGTVNYGTAQDKADFDQRLREHRQLVAELVAGEQRLKERKKL